MLARVVPFKRALLLAVTPKHGRVRAQRVTFAACEAGVSTSFCPGQHRDQKRRHGYSGLDLVGQGESEGHMLAHIASEVQLFKKP